MEGLLPMVFKAIKKNKTRHQYQCLSSGAAQSYNIADFYGNNIGTQNDSVRMTHSAEKNMEERYSHRQHISIGDFYVGYWPTIGGGHSGGGGGGGGSPPPMQKQFLRFRSQRMFSCVTGSS